MRPPARLLSPLVQTGAYLGAFSAFSSRFIGVAGWCNGWFANGEVASSTPGRPLSDNDLRHTRAYVTKQYNLVPVAG